MKTCALITVAFLSLAGCKSTQDMTITSESWGAVDGKPVALYTLDNGNGMIARITNYGGIVTELHVPDGNGVTEDVALGYDNLDGYIEATPYFGAMVGRVGNRIANGRFTLDGKTYQLAQNNDPHHLHGGDKGWDKVVWTAEPLNDARGAALRLTYVSPDGEEGYPGTVEAIVDYILTPANELWVEMSATTDAPTPINIVHHTYWNLAGHGSGPILDHELALDCARYTPADDTLIPTGRIALVKDTPFDFTRPERIGARIDDVPGAPPGGYDLNFVIDNTPPQGSDDLHRAASVRDPQSGRIMEVWTTMPGIQFYSGNFLDGTITGKDGAVYHKHTGFCLETQYYPDAINKRGTPGWPDPVLNPGERYRHVMVHRFR